MSQEKITIEFTADDWRHAQRMISQGAEVFVDNCIKKANSLIETIEAALPKPEQTAEIPVDDKTPAKPVTKRRTK